MAYDFSVTIDAIDKVSGKLININQRLDELRQKAQVANNKVEEVLTKASLGARLKIRTEQAQASLNRLNDKIKKIRQDSKQMISAGAMNIAAGTGVLSTLAFPINEARKAELAFKDIKKAVQGTPEQIEALRKQFINFEGASFQELSEVGTMVGKMGFGADKVMDFSEKIIKAAKALDFSAEEAAAYVGKILSMTNQQGNAVQATNEIMDMVAHLENQTSGVMARGILSVWKRSSNLFGQLNFDNKEMAGFSTFINEVGDGAEAASTNFRSMMMKFVSIEDKFGFFQHIKEKGLQGLRDVIEEISSMNIEERMKTFGTIPMIMINKLLDKENLLKLEVAIKKSGEAKGAVEREWKLFRATFDEKLNDFKKKLVNLLTSIGNPLKDVVGVILTNVQPIFVKMTNWVDKNQELARNIGIFIGAIGTAVIALGSLKIIIGVIGFSLGALSPIITLISGKYGILSAAQWILNAAMAANPIGLMILGITSLVTVVGLLTYNFKSVSKWLKNTFGWFSNLISSLNINENAAYLFSASLRAISIGLNGIRNFLSPVINLFYSFMNYIDETIDGSPLLKSFFQVLYDGFNMLVSPIKYVTDLLSYLTEKFNIVGKIQSVFGSIKSAMTEGVSSAHNLLAGRSITTGWQDGKEKQVLNLVKNKATVDINVRNDGQNRVDTVAKGNLPVRLRTVENGIY